MGKHQDVDEVENASEIWFNMDKMYYWKFFCP